MIASIANTLVSPPRGTRASAFQTQWQWTVKLIDKGNHLVLDQTVANVNGNGWCDGSTSGALSVKDLEHLGRTTSLCP